MSGYVRIHRTLIGHPAFRNDAEAMAFAWLVAKAAWKPTRVRYKERGIHLGRGQLAISQRDMARSLDRDKAWIERLWKRLRAEAMVTVDSEAGVAVITICNYDEYQACSDAGEAAGEAPPKAGARQAQGTEQRMEEGKKEETPIAPKGGRRGKTVLPADWKLPPASDLPPKARACAEKWTGASYETEGEGFVLYWRSSGRMMKDWGGAWANRVISRHEAVMRAQKFGNAPPDNSGKVELSAQQLRERAEWFVRHGQPDRAEDCRRKAIALENRQAA